MERKVYRSVLLKGVISKKRASKLYNFDDVIVRVKGYDVIIYRDDFGDLIIDVWDAMQQECCGGSFDDLGWED